MVLILTLVLLTVILCTVLSTVKKRVDHFKLFKNRGIPGPRPSLIFGNLLALRFSKTKSLMDCLTGWEKRYGPTFGYFSGTRPLLIIRDLDVIKDVLVKRSHKHFINRVTPMVKVKPLMDSLAGLRGQRWKEVRNILSPTFSASKMRRHMTGLMNSSISVTKEILMDKGQEDCDILALFQGMSCQVIGECALAMTINSQWDGQDEFLMAVREFMNHAIGPLIYAAMCFPWIGKAVELVANKFSISGKMTHIVCQHVKRAMSVRRPQGRDGERRRRSWWWSLGGGHNDTKNIKTNTVDMLQLMLDAADPNPAQFSGPGDQAAPCIPRKVLMTDDEIVANCWVFLLGGFETTASALTFITYLLAKNPTVQQTLFEELKSTFPEDDEIPTYGQVNKLPYLDQVVCESLRIYPPVVSFIIRETTKETRVGDFVVPEGTCVHIPVWLIHHDPLLWPNPDKFDPARFSPEAKKGRHPMSWIPFGAGPRKCIGMRFALLEIKLTLSRLVRTFRLLPSENTPEVLKFVVPTVTIVPESPIFVKFQERSQVDSNQNVDV